MNQRKSTFYSLLGMTACLIISANRGLADVLSMAPGLTSVEFVPVGNPGNTADAELMNDGTIGYGSVPYPFRIGKYEVTAAQYTEFLNAVAATDAYGLYNSSMAEPAMFFGCNIERLGSDGSYTYSVAADWANRPVNYVSFWDSLRFANWLHNGQPIGPQDASTTEDGAYTLAGYIGTVGTAISRNPGAKFWIPSEHEWYKAAYYDPVAGHYWDFQAGSDASPSNILSDPPPDPGNFANFNDGDFAIGSPYYRTAAGTFATSKSPYGTFDQGGNILEWNEAIATPSFRGLRGGSFNSPVDQLDASFRHNNFPTLQNGVIGFRIATVPEPLSMQLALLVVACRLAAGLRRSESRGD